jgi:oxalate decarboxylase/phosphoglucose isomerase-like protein (cupin superfamily)
MMAGDSAIVPRDTPHRFVNRSQDRAVTFNVYAPKAYSLKFSPRSCRAADRTYR